MKEGKLSRRNFMELGGVAAIAGAAMLAGCSSGSASASKASASASASAAAASTSAASVSASAAAADNGPKVTWNGNVVDTNAADRLPEKYEGDLKDYFKNRDFVHQVGFYAPDWKAFVQGHHDLFGSGPFYHTTNTFGKLIYKGQEVDCTGLKFEACYGGWGAHSIEVVQQVGDAPTMFTEFNDMTQMGINHLHVFVEDLEQAIEACNVLGIEVITIGYSDVTNALKKAEQTGADTEAIKARAEKPSFLVVDMRPQFGAMVQLIGPSARMIHDLIIKDSLTWDGETDLIRELGA